MGDGRWEMGDGHLAVFRGWMAGLNRIPQAVPSIGNGDLCDCIPDGRCTFMQIFVDGGCGLSCYLAKIQRAVTNTQSHEKDPTH
jgi:hypothetical protein